MLKRLLLAFLVIVLLLLAWEWLTFPDVAKLATERPTTTAFMEQRKEQLREDGKSDALEYRWVPYGKISPYLRRAVLVAEDNSFYEHQGVDVKGMREALERDLKRRKVTHGGSTITQQLAKNLYLSPSRNPLRKVREYFIARSLEEHLSKKRILEIYLNVVEFGERTYGAEAAARHYFDKGASLLNPSQAALLAGCLPNPRVMSPASPNKRLRWRQKMILSRMKRWGHLAEEEVLAPKKSEPKVEEPAAATDTAPPPAQPDSAEPTDTSVPEVVPEGPEPPDEAAPQQPAVPDSAPPVDTAPGTTTTRAGTQP